MEFAIGQVTVTIKIMNFFTGTRRVDVKANGIIGDKMLKAELSIVETAQTPFMLNVQFEEVSNEKKGIT